MSRLKPAGVLAILFLACFAWFGIEAEDPDVNPARYEAAEQSNPESLIVVAESQTTGPSGAETALTQHTTVQPPELSEAVSVTANADLYDARLDPRLASEPDDPSWARPMEAVLDSTLRSLGGYVDGIREVRCRTTVCRVVLTYQPSVNLMDNETRLREAFIPLTRNFGRVMHPILDTQADRLNSTSAIEVAPRSPNAPWEAVFYLVGPPLTEEDGGTDVSRVITESIENRE